jgi:hypothetical protein
MGMLRDKACVYFSYVITPLAPVTGLLHKQWRVKAAQKMLRFATSVGTVSVVYSVLLFYTGWEFLGTFRRGLYWGRGIM